MPTPTTTPAAAVYDAKRVVEAVLIDLVRARIPIAFGPASLARAEEYAQAMLRLFSIEAVSR